MYNDSVNLSIPNNDTKMWHPYRRFSKDWLIYKAESMPRIMLIALIVIVFASIFSNELGASEMVSYGILTLVIPVFILLVISLVISITEVIKTELKLRRKN